MRLRPITDQDFELLSHWYGREELSEYFRRLPAPFAWNSSTFSTSYIAERDGNRLGLVCLSNIDPQNRKLEVGVLIDPKECTDRRPASIEAFHEIFNYFFNHLGFRRAECAVLSTRNKLIEWLRSEGWTIEGLRRQSAFFKGEWHDEIVLSYLDEDYRKRGAK